MEQAERQASNAILLVRPAAFGFNTETARTNAFATASDQNDVGRSVLQEFDRVADGLASCGVEVLMLNDAPAPAKPDAVFPNNWVSFHADGTMVVYPMESQSRRLERGIESLRHLLKRQGFVVRRIVDLTAHEDAHRFLEGTGSLILDRPNRQAFASLSPRTHTAVIEDFDARLGYSTIVFDAQDRAGRPLYHTNVLMSLGTCWAVLCIEAVAANDRKQLIEQIEATGRKIINVDFEQLKCFACNMIELESSTGEPVLAMSTSAKASLRPNQRQLLEQFGTLVPLEIPTVEHVGGGSIRCMIADIHLPRR